MSPLPILYTYHTKGQHRQKNKKFMGTGALRNGGRGFAPPPPWPLAYIFFIYLTAYERHKIPPLATQFTPKTTYPRF
jgi:hypothetical protein